MDEDGAEQPILLINAGVPKAGTTWLYDYLWAHPDCFLREIKEVNYFNTRAGRPRDYIRGLRRQQRAEAEKQVRKTGWFERTRRRRLRRRIEAIDDWLEMDAQDRGASGYWRYLQKGRDRQSLVADLTPEYMMLDADGFRQIAATAADVRFLLLLRDPVDRIWSHMRMNAQREAAPGTLFDALIRTGIDRYLDRSHEGIRLRSDYEKVLRNLTDAVAPEKLHVTFFEHLFDPETGPETLRGITDFLGIRAIGGAFGQKTHASPSLALAEEDRRRLSAELRPQYEFCNGFFGGELPARWKRNMLLEAG